MAASPWTCLCMEVSCKHATGESSEDTYAVGRILSWTSPEVLLKSPGLLGLYFWGEADSVGAVVPSST